MITGYFRLLAGARTDKSSRKKSCSITTHGHMAADVEESSPSVAAFPPQPLHPSSCLRYANCSAREVQMTQKLQQISVIAKMFSTA